MDSLKHSQQDEELPQCVTDRGLVLTLRGTLFINGRAELKPANTILDRLVALLSGNVGRDVMIEGHTDSLGSEGYNHRLSQRRADCVKSYLIEHGVSALRLTALGKGGSVPVATNNTSAGRELNSRVEVIVQAPLDARSVPQ